MMHTFSSATGAVRALSVASYSVLRPGLWLAVGLFALAGLASAGQAPRTAPAPQAPPTPAASQAARLGEPVNRYAPNANIFALYEPGEIQPWHVKGKVWLLAGQPGESNVTVLVGDEGALVVDTGAKSMAPKLVEQIQRLAQEHAMGIHKTVRMIVNTNGAPDHVGGNQLVRASGRQVIAGEAAATANAFGDGGAAVWAHQNVLNRLTEETAAGGANAPTQEQWPSDTTDQEVYGMYFTDEAIQFYHAPKSTTDGQMMILFRQADVIAAGDVLNMTSYPTIDVARGGTIDGELVALNKLIDMIVPDDQVAGGTVVIPGHGRLTDLGDVARYTVMVTSIRNRVQYYKNQGKTLEQVLALKPSSEYDERWGAKSGLGSTREFITSVYNTLVMGAPVFFSMETYSTVPATGPDSAKQRF